MANETQIQTPIQGILFIVGFKICVSMKEMQIRMNIFKFFFLQLCMYQQLLPKFLSIISELQLHITTQNKPSQRLEYYEHMGFGEKRNEEKGIFPLEAMALLGCLLFPTLCVNSSQKLDWY